MKVMLPMAEQPRTCGNCSLCCKVLSIIELDKPVGVWCPHAKKNAGCTIYANRPDVCVAFKCHWLEGLQELEHRPDKIHGVVASSIDGDAVVIYEDKGWPGHASNVLRGFINRVIKSGELFVVVVCGESRRIIARPDLMVKLKLITKEDAVSKKLGVFTVERS